MANHSIYAGALQFQLSDAWEDRSIYTFVAPEQSIASALPTMAKTQGFRPNVVVTREPKGKYERIDAYAKDQLAASQKGLPNLKVVAEVQLTLAGKAAIKRTFTFVVPQQNAQVQQVQIFMLHGDWLYMVTFSTLPQHFSEHEKMFDEIVSKMSFGD